MLQYHEYIYALIDKLEETYFLIFFPIIISFSVLILILIHIRDDTLIWAEVENVETYEAYNIEYYESRFGDYCRYDYICDDVFIHASTKDFVWSCEKTKIEPQGYVEITTYNNGIVKYVLNVR